MSDVARAEVDGRNAAEAAAAVNRFGLDLFAQVADQPGNLMISPASIALALAMTRAGARGATAAEMDAVLHGLGSDAMADAVNTLDAALDARTAAYEDDDGATHQVTLQVANALFPQRGMALEAAFLDAMASRYGAGVWLVDYVNDAERAREAINEWVADNTEGRIPEIATGDDINESTRLAIANTIYLKAPWHNAFLEPTTRGDFSRADGSVVRVPLMDGTISGGAYAREAGWFAVELPYVSRALAMLVIVPDDLASFEATFDAAALDAIIGSLERGKFNLRFPRFDVESRLNLAEILEELGMPSAFNDAADFSGITEAERLAIGRVIHQANMTVDEKGTEAAAATIVGMEVSGTSLAFRVDRPFLVVLRDVPTGALVFIGRVADPSETR